MKRIRKVVLKDGKVVKKGIVSSREKRSILKKKDGTTVVEATAYHTAQNAEAHAAAVKRQEAREAAYKAEIESRMKTQETAV